MKVLAKKGRAGDVGLWTHTQDVLSASRELFGQPLPTVLGTAWLRFFKVDPSRWAEFRILLDLACLWHDIGKATCSFQQMIHERTSQIIRHEYLSYLILASAMRGCPELKQFEFPLLHAILGHHLKSGESYYRDRLDEYEGPVQVYDGDPDVQLILRETQCLLGSGPVTIPNQLKGRWATGAEKWRKRLTDKWKERTDADPTLFRALALALIASDAAGSALRRTHPEHLELWIQGCFHNNTLTPDQLEETIIQGRIREIKATSGSYTPNPLQKLMPELPSRAAVVSPCGSGKTLAAFLWAHQQLRTHQASRIIFLYPTRNTATEGFRDYVSWGKDEAALMHGTSDFDLDGMNFNGDERGETDPRHMADYSIEEAMFALGYWNKRYLSATVDSFLAFTANRYGPDCLLPVLCDSILIVDEIHAMDLRMFRNFCSFLQEFDLPVLVMTATLPPQRRKLLEDLQLPVHDGGEQGQKDARLARYSIRFVEDSILSQVERWLGGPQKRLLVVCNQVATCQAEARKIENLIQAISPQTRLLVYHSRFKLKDRRDRHEEVIQQFKATDGRIVVVSTQVCQMSLDLDAESLYSEWAPLPDLIQRMGRTNRHGHYARGEVVLFPNQKDKPYEKAELDEAQRQLRSLADLTSVSQWDLAELINRLDTQELTAQHTVGLVESIPKMEAQPYRDIQEFAIDSLLKKDVEDYIQFREARDAKAAGLVVPVPRYDTERHENWRLPPYLRIAKSTTYNTIFGYEVAP